MLAAQRLLCLAARTALTPRSANELETLLGRGIDWPQVKELGGLHEVVPLVSETLRERTRAALPDEWTTWSERVSLGVLIRNVALADELLEVVEAVRAVGVDPIPVKGVVIAETLYGGLGLRPAADIDVLVRPEELEPARRGLRSLGYVQRAAVGYFAGHPYHDAQYYRPTAAGVACLELHMGLWDPKLFRWDPGIWERTGYGQLRGSPVRLLSDEDTLLHLAIHRARSPLKLRFVCDVAELVRHRGPSLDWELALALARRMRARTALFASLRLAGELLGADVPSSILTDLRVGQTKRRVLERTCGRTALFRPAPGRDAGQQATPALRLLEQDGIARLGPSIARATRRRARAWLSDRRRTLRGAGSLRSEPGGL
jgi:hypothetical protein